jgi:xanthine dehydrogenase YagS FAD-binding subunit
VPLEQFFVLPAQNVYRENVLAQNEIITHVLVPPPAPGTRSAYVKEREKDSYDWALASAAVVVTPDAVREPFQAARVVLGGVAPVPWRAADAEKALVCQPFNGPGYRARGRGRPWPAPARWKRTATRSRSPRPWSAAP